MIEQINCQEDEIQERDEREGEGGGGRGRKPEFEFSAKVRGKTAIEI
jgi:hypothetical protein